MQLLQFEAGLQPDFGDDRLAARAVQVERVGAATALGVIRAALDSAYGSYLRRRGKKRWCDKSLDSFQFGETIRMIYPQAKFICLVRHCMDVISSGVRNCPWGVSRYGFDSFVAKYPGNSVAAIWSYWLSCTRTMLDFYDQHQDSCVLVRYEDLVTAPEQTVPSTAAAFR